MWKYMCLCKGLFLIIFATNIWGLNIGYPRTREQIYIDVLKNISRVNNILNELLQNYKQVKNDYEAKAKLENDLSIETDGSFDTEESNVKFNRINNGKEDFHPVTQMILFDEGIQDDISRDSNTAEEEKDKIPKEIIQQSSMENMKIDKIRPSQNLYLSEKEEEPINQLDKPEMKIIGAAVKYIDNGLNNLDNQPKQLEKSIFDEVFNLEGEYLQKNIGRNAKPVLRIGSDDDKNMRNNKNINMIKTTNIYDMLRKWNSIRDYIAKMSLNKISRPNPKFTLVLIRSNNKDQNMGVANNNYESDDVNSEIEMIKDQLKSKILRDAYGDACLKVAVRKCYKTLLEVRKNTCGMDFHCKDSFKEHFKAHSKTGCIKEFNYHGNQESENNETIDEDKTFYKSGKNQGVESYDAVFQDIGRTSLNINYYDLCLPVMITEVKTDTKQQIKRNKKNQKGLSRDLNKTEPINILRDRYEMECRRMSREKCERACIYAITMTCGQHVCMRREKREFDKRCRSECKYSFMPNGESDSYSDSDSYSYDDSSDSISSW